MISTRSVKILMAHSIVSAILGIMALGESVVSLFDVAIFTKITLSYTFTLLCACDL